MESPILSRGRNKEDIMTRLLWLACAASLALTPVRADEDIRTCASFKTYQEFQFHRWERGFVESLNFPVPPVVESALRDVVAVKLAQPDITSGRVYARICELADGGATPAVRYKAAMVRLVFDFPEIFAEERGREYRNDQELFTALADRLHRSTLVMAR